MKEKEENFRKIFHHSNDAIFVIDPPNDRILEVNPKACQILSYSRKELLSMKVSDVHPYEMPKLLDFTKSVTKNGHGWTNELTCLTKNGDFLSAEISASTIDINGTNYIIAMVRDITERKRSEEMLRESLTQIAKKNRYETIISTVTRSVHQSINLQDVLENAVEAMNNNINKADIVGIYLVEGQEAVLEAHKGLTDRYIERAGRIPYPKGITWKAIREGNPIYCEDAENDTFIGPAGRELGTKSYLSMPIRFEDRAVGCINVNSFEKSAFDEGELKLMEIVAQQIGIAINNARQAEALRQSDLLQDLTVGTASATGDDFFRSLVRHLASALNVRYAFVTQCTDVTLTRVRTLAFWMGEGFGNNVEYALADTPCENVIGGNVCYYPENLKKLFPKDEGLAELKAESFVGVPISDSRGNILGHLAAFDERPMDEKPRGISILQIFAARAGAEFERKRAEDALRGSEERFRTLFESAPIGLSINDANGRFIQVNRAFQEMLQYTSDELRKISFKELTFEEDLPDSEILFGELVAGKRKDFSIEKRYRRKDASLIWANTNCSAVRDVDGNFIYTFAMVEDISERKQAEEALIESLAQISKKNRYEAIISAITRSVHQSINLQEVLENAVESMSKNIDKVQLLAIYLVEGEEVVIRSHRGFTARYIEKAGRIPYPKGYNWKTIIEGKPIYVADVDKDNIIGPAGREMGIKSYLSMPVYYEGKTIGVIGINSFQKDAFHQEELNLLEIIGEQIGIAIKNAKQAEALREALLEVEKLKNRLEAENVYLQEEIKTEYNFEEIVGQSETLQKVLRKVEQVAPTNTTVLIQGETGTGKELIARAIHNLSPRKDRPLVKVNCAAISAGLVESELFGHEKGAFTGAVQQRVGRFELADGGTIFLDEVGDLPLETQVKLLRVLQESEFERVGSSKSIKVNLRIIAATNRDLVEAVKEGTFRSDLFYRLSVFPVQVPPLRERKSDIPLIVNFFVGKFAKSLGKKVEGVSRDTLDLFVDYSWPGNIRELQNVIERAVVLARDTVLRIDESIILRLDTRPDAGFPNFGSTRLEDIERSHILSVLEETDWVIEGKKGAASILGLNPSTLRSRMRKIGIKKPG